MESITIAPEERKDLILRMKDESRSSTSLLLKRRVQALELDACILRCEAPVDLVTCSVASLLPRSRLGLECLKIRHSSIQALPAQYAELDHCYVQLATVLGRVVDLQLLAKSFGLSRIEHNVEGSKRYGC